LASRVSESDWGLALSEKYKMSDLELTAVCEELSMRRGEMIESIVFFLVLTMPVKGDVTPDDGRTEEKYDWLTECGRDGRVK